MTKNSKVILALMAALLGGCKQRVAKSSQKHNFGDTTLPGERTECKQAEVETKFPITVKYLRRILDEIAQFNQAAFKDDLAPDKLCIQVEESQEINAEAHVGDNSIYINSELINAFENDAQIAGVVAHELAHLSMNTRHAETPTWLIVDPNWPALKIDYHNRLKKMMLDRQPLRAELHRMEGLHANLAENFAASAKENAREKIAQ